MDIPWPINTSFQISSRVAIETWTVASNSDPTNGIVAEGTPLGKSLLFSGGKRFCSYVKPDKTPFLYRIVSVRPPHAGEYSFVSPLDYYLYSYRNDPTGIRYNPYMADICLGCGHQNPLIADGKRSCESCGIWWYRDHCWKCLKKVDSRDPRTPRCVKCRYWICASCGSCFCGAGFLWKRDF